MTPRDPAPDSVLRDLLAALGGFDAANGAARDALSGGLTVGGWHAAVAALDAALDALEAPLGGALTAAALAGAWRVGASVGRGSSSPPPDRPAATPPPAPDRLREAYEALPEADRPSFLQALDPLSARQLSVSPGVADPAVVRALEDVPAATLPLAEKAAGGLLSSGLANETGLRRLVGGARARAGAVRNEMAAAAGRRLDDAATEAVREHPGDVRAARKVVEGELNAGPIVLPPARVEAAVRHAVQVSYADGMEQLLADPLVGDGLPYVETIPIPDSRLTPLCAQCSVSGIGGGPIYRRDDPTWERVKNPRHFGCRCGTQAISLREAARRGVGEAVDWLKTGRPPAEPAWVPMPPLAIKEGL